MTDEREPETPANTEAPRYYSKHDYAAQLAEEELSSWGEGALRDLRNND